MLKNLRILSKFGYSRRKTTIIKLFPLILYFTILLIKFTVGIADPTSPPPPPGPPGSG